MNWLIKWGVKKYAVSLVNDLVTKYSNNVQAALAIVDKLLAKAESVIEFLKSLRAKLEDNKITEEEADAVVDEATKLTSSILA